MSINAQKLKIEEQGWYENGKRICEMKDDGKYMKFTIRDIF